MQLPFDRARLAERNRLDEIEERDEAAKMSLAERFALTLELSDLARELALAAGASWLHGDRDEELAMKSKLWVAPLRALQRP